MADGSSSTNSNSSTSSSTSKHETEGGEMPRPFCTLCEGHTQLVDLGGGMSICKRCRGMQQRHLEFIEDNFDRPYEAPDLITPSILLGSVNSTVDADEMKKLGVTRVLVAASGIKANFPQHFEYLHLPWDDQLSQKIAFDLDAALAFLSAADRDYEAFMKGESQKMKSAAACKGKSGGGGGGGGGGGSGDGTIIEEEEGGDSQGATATTTTTATTATTATATATGEPRAHRSAAPPRVLVHCHAGVSRSATVVIAHLMRLWQCKYEVAEVYVRAKRSVIFPNSAFVRQLRALEPALNDPEAVLAETIVARPPPPTAQ